MEASVAGGIPIHAVLREGISGDRVMALYGILNGTSNYILTEMEKRGDALETVLAEAQRLGYAEADPSADIDGFDARSKLAILAALAFGERITPSDIFVEGIRRISPIDFNTRINLGHTIRLICAARQTPDGLILSVRPALIPRSTILAGVQGAYNAVWVKGQYGEDTFYYGRGAGRIPTGVAVVSDLMRVAREIRSGSPERVSPFAHERLGEYKPVPVTLQKRAYYLRFRVDDRPGIIATLARHPGREAHQPGGGAAGAVRDQARSAVRHHGGADLGAVGARRAVEQMSHARLSERAAAGAAHGAAVMKKTACSFCWSAALALRRRPPRTPTNATRRRAGARGGGARAWPIPTATQRQKPAGTRRRDGDQRRA